MAKRHSDIIQQPDAGLFNELSLLIEQSQTRLQSYANSTLTALFWQVGKRINENILQYKRADYGKQIVPTVSAQLEKLHGRNFTEKNVRRMMKFAGLFADFEIVVPLARQLSWSHFVEILPLKKEEARLFYAQQSITENWGIRQLREQINSKGYERAGIANTQLREGSLVPFNTFKDPYILDFLRLKNEYLENRFRNCHTKRTGTLYFGNRQRFRFCGKTEANDY